MENARLREQVLTAFLHAPNTSIPVSMRMSRGISEPYAKVAKCVDQLLKDGMLKRQMREGRLPPLFYVTRAAKELLRQEEYNVEQPLKDHENRALYDAVAIEKQFANDQERVLTFIRNSKMFVSTLMVQDLLRASVNDNNLRYTTTVLAQLAWNDEIEMVCYELLWKYKKTATVHVWN